MEHFVVIDLNISHQREEVCISSASVENCDSPSGFLSTKKIREIGRPQDDVLSDLVWRVKEFV